MEQNLLEIKNLTIDLYTERGCITPVYDVSLNIHKNEVFGLVGESGCGKSFLSQSIIRLHDDRTVKYKGDIFFNGLNILKTSNKNIKSIRGNRISMIFQDVVSYLNPTLTVGNQIVEAIMIHQNINEKEAHKKALDVLKLTGIPSPERRMYEYPFELSGGMKQRVMIAIALSCEPEILIADEPTTALDVTIQAQVLDLILDLKRDFNTAVLLITHDLGVIAEMCSKVAIMYLGQIVEEADTETIFKNPLHPYTQGLMSSIPTIGVDLTKKLSCIDGTVPNLFNIPSGCRFSNRCSYKEEYCERNAPPLIIHSNEQKVRCFLYTR